MTCCRPSTIAKAHRGSSAYMISIAQTCAPKQSVGARDVRYLAIRTREVLIYKEIASWAARNAFPKWQEGRHPHCHFRGLLRLHSRYGPPDRSAAHRRPLSRGSNPCGYPHKPLVSYRINRQLSGWIPPPLMIRAFGGVGPGLLATALAVLAIHYYLVPPLNSFALKDNICSMGVSELPRLILFAIASLFITFLRSAQRAAAGSLRRSRDDLRASAQALQQLNDEL